MKQRLFAVRAVHNPQGKPVAYFPYREWRQAELNAAKLTAKDRNRSEMGQHYVSIVKVPEDQFAKMTA